MRSGVGAVVAIATPPANVEFDQTWNASTYCETLVKRLQLLSKPARTEQEQDSRGIADTSHSIQRADTSSFGGTDKGKPKERQNRSPEDKGKKHIRVLVLSGSLSSSKPTLTQCKVGSKKHGDGPRASRLYSHITVDKR